MKRFIFHLDMDAFYASIEQRDNPAYRGKPVIVGADPKNGEGRGVVAACSYEARNFGIHSALPISRAYRLCPLGIYLRPNMEKYRSVSKEIRKILLRITPLVEPISIDEAFLDVTNRVESMQDASGLARKIKDEIFSTQQLTASVGVAPSKFVAKIASDFRKPNGLTAVPGERVQEFLDPLPIARIWGVGPRTEEKLREMKIRTIAELRRYDRELLERRFGKQGDHLWKLANGVDDRPVITHREPKSIGQERTFGEDTNDLQLLRSVLLKLSLKIAKRLSKRNLGGKTITLKLRYSDFTTFTRQTRFRDLTSSADDLRAVGEQLLQRYWRRDRKIRLIGLSVSSLGSLEEVKQLRLF